MSQPTDLFPVADDDALSVHSDFSEASEMVSAVLCRNSFFCLPVLVIFCNLLSIIIFLAIVFIVLLTNLMRQCKYYSYWAMRCEMTI